MDINQNWNEIVSLLSNSDREGRLRNPDNPDCHRLHELLRAGIGWIVRGGAGAAFVGGNTYATVRVYEAIQRSYAPE